MSYPHGYELYRRIDESYGKEKYKLIATFPKRPTSEEINAAFEGKPRQAIESPCLIPIFIPRKRKDNIVSEEIIVLTKIRLLFFSLNLICCVINAEIERELPGSGMVHHLPREFSIRCFLN